MLWAVNCRGEQPPASYSQVRLGQSPGQDMLTALMQRIGVGISEQHIIAQPRAHHTGFSTKSGWQHTSHGLAVASSAFSYCSATEQPRTGLWSVLQMPAPHPGKQEAARATPAAGGEQRAALCSAQHAHHARTDHSNVTVGCAATAIAQFAPLSRQAECQHGSLCPLHPQRTHHLGTVLPYSLASSCRSNSML